MEQNIQSTKPSLITNLKLALILLFVIYIRVFIFNTVHFKNQYVHSFPILN